MTSMILAADKHVVRPLHGDLGRIAEKRLHGASDGKPYDERKRRDFRRRRIFLPKSR